LWQNLTVTSWIERQESRPTGMSRVDDGYSNSIQLHGRNTSLRSQRVIIPLNQQSAQTSLQTSKYSELILNVFGIQYLHTTKYFIEIFLWRFLIKMVFCKII